MIIKRQKSQQEINYIKFSMFSFTCFLFYRPLTSYLLLFSLSLRYLTIHGLHILLQWRYVVDGAPGCSSELFRNIKVTLMLTTESLLHVLFTLRHTEGSRISVQRGRRSGFFTISYFYIPILIYLCRTYPDSGFSEVAYVIQIVDTDLINQSQPGNI